MATKTTTVALKIGELAATVSSPDTTDGMNYLTNLLIGISSDNEGRLSSAPVGSGCGLKRPAERENVHA